MVRAYRERAKESAFWENSHTVAFGINVPKPLGDFLVLEALYQTEGCAIAVEDREILGAIRSLASEEGLFVCPEGASLYAAAASLKQSGWLKPDERVVMLNTGAGIKYPNTLSFDLPYLEKDGEI